MILRALSIPGIHCLGLRVNMPLTSTYHLLPVVELILDWCGSVQGVFYHKPYFQILNTDQETQCLFPSETKYNISLAVCQSNDVIAALVGQFHILEPSLPETNSYSTWKWILGIRLFPFLGNPIFIFELLVSRRVIHKSFRNVTNMDQGTLYIPYCQF